MTKKAKKLKKRKLAKAISTLVFSEGERRREALNDAIKAAQKRGDHQSARSFAYQLAHDDAVAVRKGAAAVLARAGLSDEDQPRAIFNASSSAIRSAQRRAPDRGAGRGQRATLESAYSGLYEPGQLNEDETMLESQRRMLEAETQLRKAKTPQEREAWSYQLSRERLIAAHRAGEI